jgi:hypothetical protein
MPNSPSVDDLVARITEALRPQLETIAERKAQSVKDKRINALEKQYGDLDDFRKVLAEAKELKERGLNDEQIEDKMLLRRLVDSLSHPAATQAPWQEQPVVDDISRKILSDAGIAENDADVVALMRQQYPNDAARIAAFAQLAIQRAKQPQPNPAQANQTAPATTPTVDLEAAYQKELWSVKGDAQKVADLRQKYRKLGLRI